jgi:hypothetical protein
MGGLIFTLVVLPSLVIGLAIALAGRRERRPVTASLAGRIRYLYVLAGQAWTSALQAHARMANLEDRVRELERNAHGHGQKVER